MRIKIQNDLRLLGFEPLQDDNNLYHRLAESNNHDVIRYLPNDDCYNLCTAEGCRDFINEDVLFGLLDPSISKISGRNQSADDNNRKEVKQRSKSSLTLQEMRKSIDSTQKKTLMQKLKL